MFIMGLCMFVCNYLQTRISKNLIKNQEALPAQVFGATQNPGMRWVFEIMSDISIVHIKNVLNGRSTKLVKGLTPLKEQIIRLFGHNACDMYGISIEE